MRLFRWMCSRKKDAVLPEDVELKRARRLFGIIYFVQGMSGLPNMSWNYFMKYQMRLSDERAQIFDSLLSIGWYIKPLWGYISDHYPIFGYRRRSYLILMPLLASFSWFAIALAINMGAVFYVLMLVLWNIGAVGYAFTDVVGDGHMNVLGKRLSAIGSFVNLQWQRFALASLLVAVIQGYVQTRIQAGTLGYPLMFTITAIMPLLTALVAAFSVDEERHPLYVARGWKNTTGEFFRNIARVVVWCMFWGPMALVMYTIGSGYWVSEFVQNTWRRKKETGSFSPAFARWRNEYRHLWYAGLFIFFLGVSPSVGYFMFSFETDVLKFEPRIYATIGFISAFIFYISIGWYARFVRRFPRVRWSTYLYVLSALSVVTLPLGFYYFVPESHWLAFRIPFPWDAYKAAIEHIPGLADSLLNIKPDNATLAWVVQHVHQAAAAVLRLVYGLFADFLAWNRFHWFSLINSIIFGLIMIPAWLIPLTIAGEVSPQGNEAMVYAAFMSLSNGSKFISSFLGGQIALLMKWTGLTWFAFSWFDLAQTDNFRVLLLELFIYVGATTSLIGIIFIYLLDKELRRRNIVVHLTKK